MLVLKTDHWHYSVLHKNTNALNALVELTQSYNKDTRTTSLALHKI